MPAITPISQTSNTPILDWESAKAMVNKAEDKLKGIPSKYGNTWAGMGIKANQRWERYQRRINKVLSHYQNLVWADACRGCGEYNPGGGAHNNTSCRVNARFQG